MTLEMILRGMQDKDRRRKHLIVRCDFIIWGLCCMCSSDPYCCTTDQVSQVETNAKHR